MNHRSIILALFALAPGLAHAQGQPYSVDAEFLRPTYGADSLLGVDVATAKKPFTFRVGAHVMYTRNPVTLWDRLEGTELGAVVTDRFGVMLGASFDISNRLTVNAMIPAAYNLGGDDNTDVKQYEAPGVGLQDIGVGARLTAIRSKPFNLGIRAGLIFPSGRSQAYLGDSGMRPTFGLLASVHFGRTMIATDIGAVIRASELQTDEDFTASHELNGSIGLRHKLPAATRLGFNVQLLSRLGLNEGLFSGGGENGLEAMAGIEVYPSKNITWDITAGRGLTDGYATTDLRVLTGIRIDVVPKEPVTVIPPPPPPPPPLEPPPIIDEPPPEEPTYEDTIIVVTEEAIEVKQAPEFIVNTTTLLDSSRPTLRQVANFINGTLPLPEGVKAGSEDDPNRNSWKIRNVEIVGHASAEGSYEYNYNLSQGRARTIWQTLIEMGVHPDRISHKGMGEVVPRDPSKLGRELTEQELQDNRRVEFHILRQYDDTEAKPFDGFKSTVKAPWSGEVIRVVVPEKPAPPPEEKPLDEVDEFEQPFSLDDLDEGFDEEPTNDTGEDTGGEQ